MNTVEKENQTWLSLFVDSCKALDFSRDDRREIYNASVMCASSSGDREYKKDFSVDLEEGEYRFININAIDEIQCEELASDPYTLGCFNSNFLASCTGWPEFLIAAAQEGEQFEAIGNSIIEDRRCLVVEIQDEYRRVDGYGHHFAHYDFEELHLSLWGTMYYVFRTN